MRWQNAVDPKKDVMRVSDQPATIWGDGLAAVKAAAVLDKKRMGKRYQGFCDAF